MVELQAHTKEILGSWMLVTRKDRRYPRKFDKKVAPNKQLAAEKTQGATKVTMYDNQLYSNRFAPLEDMEEEMFIGKEPEHMTTHGIGNDDPQREMESNSEPLTETKAQELATAQTEGENGA
nr:uncharacterized protein LOC109157461 [Ipomoea trifida]